MKKDFKIITGVVGLLAVVFVISAVAYRAMKQKDSAASDSIPMSRLVPEDSWTLGPSMARVTLVEFMDPECESCAAFHSVVKKVLADYPQSLRLVIRYMPFHGNSEYAAKALEAAGAQGKYWEAMEALFTRLPEWGSHHHPRPELIPEIIQTTGVDMKRFEAELNNPDFIAKITRDREAGVQLGVRATPTFFVNGKMLQRLSYDDLVAAVEQELQK